jgi:hypothetical protein
VKKNITANIKTGQLKRNYKNLKKTDSQKQTGMNKKLTNKMK